MAWSWENAAGGAMTGAAVGSIGGPWGMAGGALVGGVIGGTGGFGNIWDDMTGQTGTANIHSRNQGLARGQQNEMLGLVGNWAATGQGPSAAQQLVEMNRSQNAANMIGSAKSMPGGNAALSNQLASEGIARGNAAATLQGAQIRSQEQQAMMQNYLTGVQGMRQQDIEMYKPVLSADQENTRGRQGFLGGIMNFGGGFAGGSM